MKKKFSLILTILGLVLGLFGTLMGVLASNAVPSSPMKLGLVIAVWFAVSAAIVGGRRRSQQLKPKQ